MENIVSILGITVGKLRNKIFRLQRILYTKQATMKMTVEEFILLNMICEKTNQISQSIAIATGKNKSVVMRMLDSLEKKGLIQRTVNPKDKRENLLLITDLGEAVIKEYYQIEEQLTDDLLLDIPKEDVKVFYRVVEQINTRANQLLIKEQML